MLRRERLFASAGGAAPRISCPSKAIIRGRVRVPLHPASAEASARWVTDGCTK